MSARRVVIDACVAVKWALRDEEATAEAERLGADLGAGDLDVLVPALLDYEVGNALRVATVKGRIREDQAALAFAKLGAVEMERRPLATTRELAFELAFAHGRSVYDASYLALAAANGLLLYTGDRRLLNAVSDRLPWVRWIGDYRLEDVPVAQEAEPSA